MHTESNTFTAACFYLTKPRGSRLIYTWLGQNFRFLCRGHRLGIDLCFIGALQLRRLSQDQTTALNTSQVHEFKQLRNATDLRIQHGISTKPTRKRKITCISSNKTNRSTSPVHASRLEAKKLRQALFHACSHRGSDHDCTFDGPYVEYAQYGLLGVPPLH